MKEKDGKLKAFNIQKNTILIALVVVVAFFQIVIISSGKASFFSPTNVTNLISQNSYVVVLTIGMLMLILTGGNIDLSIGSGVALISSLAGVLMVNLDINIYLAMIICLLVSAFLGFIQGYFIAYQRIPAFIVTLAGMLIFRGVANIIMQGVTISPFPENYLDLFKTFIPRGSSQELIQTVCLVIGIAVSGLIAYLFLLQRHRRIKNNAPAEPLYATIIKFSIVAAVIIWVLYLLGQSKGIPIVLIELVVIVAVYAYITANTVSGRQLYAVGGNEQAAKFSGINTNKVILLAYTNMGFLVGVASLMCVARFNAAAPSAGDGYELDAIGACFLGGASAYGGKGTVAGVTIGAILMGVLNNGMTIVGLDVNWQKTVKGIVLLVAVLFEVASQRNTGKGVLRILLDKFMKEDESRIA
jgi:putative multiple sugar transport system permease protein